MAINEDMTEETKDGLEMAKAESTPVQGKLGGFTPLIDTIAEGTGGIYRAAVFGKMWRYCQMKDGVCRASLSTIAAGLGMNRSTVQRHAEALVEDGYLIDLTPELKNRPHIYRDTHKAGITVSITVAENNTTVAHSNATVAESHMSKDVKKDYKKEKTLRGKTPRERTPLELELSAIQTLFAVSANIVEPQPNSRKETLSAAELWYQPIRRIQAACNGTSLRVVENAINKMRRDKLTISSPKSIEKVCIALYGEFKGSVPKTVDQLREERRITEGKQRMEEFRKRQGRNETR